MNECTFRDVIIYSSDFSRIDHINDQRILGNRLIHHKAMNDGNYLLIFRPFEISREFEITACKKHKKDEDYITRLYEETIRPKTLPKPEASVFQSYLKRVRNTGDVDSSSNSVTESYSMTDSDESM